MKITPLDIQQQQFKSKLFSGIDPDDVDAFLQTVAQEMEDLLRENSDLKEQLRRNTDMVNDLTAREAQLRDTIMAAQKVTEEMKANAQKEATLIVSEAELNGEKIVAEANQKLVQLNSQIQELRREKLQFETALKSLLDTHYKMLSISEE